jgi:hypothetical protein
MIRTNEIVLKENNEWLYFGEPDHVIATRDSEEVLPALREVESLIKLNDWYAAGFKL